MCGIAGIFSFEGHIENPMQIYGMTDLLTHRGPDDGAYKFFLDDYTAVEQYKDKKQVRIAIGHRRLKIIDLDDRANQPFTDIDNKFTIIFNGEIYNYLEIAKELRELGTIFRTDSDTEVILESYKRWGCDCFKRFNGMWALAIVDSIKKKLILARDRLGKKPLYYMFDNGYFYFGSEIKSLNIINPNENRINYRKCSLYLGSHYRYVDSDNETFFDNIKQFPKACFWEVNEKTKPTCYWNLKEIIENIDQVKKEYNWEEEFSYLLNDAVRIRLRSDVPIASLLSGGMDSTSITALALSHKSNFTSVSATFAYDQYDESQYIDSFVSMHRNNHTYIKPSAQDLLPTLEEMIQFHDEPICTSTWYSMYIMAKEISRLTKVVLTGHGGDEILGGYWDHFHFYWDTITNEHILLSNEISKWSKNHNRSLTEIEIFKNRIKNLKKNTNEILTYFSLYRNTLTPDAQKYLPFPYRNIGLDSLKSRNFYELTRETVPAVLKAEDRNMMRFSIENRCPFLDFRLVEMSFRMPNNLKIKNGIGKYILRKVMKDRIPEKIRNRKDKMGHNIPFDIWIRESLHNEIYSLLDEDSFVNNLIVKEKVKELLKQHLAGANHSMFFWQYINLHIWEKIKFNG